jgi:hypothetical protein
MDLVGAAQQAACLRIEPERTERVRHGDVTSMLAYA